LLKKAAYLGSKNRFVRGMSVREWQMCAYSNASEATLKITISLLSLEWQSLVNLENTPVQIRIDKKLSGFNGEIEKIVYAVFQFRTESFINVNELLVLNFVLTFNL
jgi:hypothetical protein